LFASYLDSKNALLIFSSIYIKLNLSSLNILSVKDRDINNYKTIHQFITFLKPYIVKESNDNSVHTLNHRELKCIQNFTSGSDSRGKAELVFEIGFEGIQYSSRHKSGVALRFPRMLRWRKDKPASEADQLETLIQLIETGR
jgi:hypothetical protein